jgi:hypothetical protein
MSEVTEGEFGTSRRVNSFLIIEPGDVGFISWKWISCGPDCEWVRPSKIRAYLGGIPDEIHLAKWCRLHCFINLEATEKDETNAGGTALVRIFGGPVYWESIGSPGYRGRMAFCAKGPKGADNVLSKDQQTALQKLMENLNQSGLTDFWKDMPLAQAASLGYEKLDQYPSDEEEEGFTDSDDDAY